MNTQLATPLQGVKDLFTAIKSIVGIALPIVASLALLAFFWGLAKFISSAGSEDAKEEGKRIMIWGVIALFVMVSIWGITNFIGANLGLNQTDSVNFPTFGNF